MVGVDYSSEAAATATARYGPEGLRVAQMNALDLGFLPASFDGACSSHLIEHFTDPEPHVAEMARVLKDDGVGCVLTPNKPADFENPFHLHLFEREELRSMLERHFGEVWLGGVDAAPHVKADLAARRVKANKVLELDVFDLRHRMPHAWYVWSYTRLLPRGLQADRQGRLGRHHRHHGRRLVRHRGARRHDPGPLRGGPGPAPGEPGLMLAVGLTGGIGSGKSAVADLLVERGAVLIDADQVARDVVAPGGPAYQPLIDRFGPGILDADGTIDRKALAAVAFADEESRLALNAITHPAIGIAMIQARDALADTDDIVVLAIPLLTAVHRETVKLHKVVVVDTPTDIALERLLSQRGFDRADAEARIKAQISREERVKEADYVLDNSGDREALEAEVAKLWDWLLEAAAEQPAHA